jgi:hypothetical protein
MEDFSAPSSPVGGKCADSPNADDHTQRKSKKKSHIASQEGEISASTISLISQTNSVQPVQGNCGISWALDFMHMRHMLNSPVQKPMRQALSTPKQRKCSPNFPENGSRSQKCLQAQCFVQILPS